MSIQVITWIDGNLVRLAGGCCLVPIEQHAPLGSDKGFHPGDPHCILAAVGHTVMAEATKAP